MITIREKRPGIELGSILNTVCSNGDLWPRSSVWVMDGKVLREITAQEEILPKPSRRFSC